MVTLLAVSAARGCPPAASAADGSPPAEALCIFGNSNGALWLVQMDSVAKELALTGEQTQQFARWADELRAENRRLLRGLLGGQGPEHEQRAAERNRQAGTIAETFHRQVVERLDPSQRTRLDELYVRYLGPRALFEPRVVSRLALSKAQQQSLREACDAGTGPPPHEDLLKLLTTQQRAQLAALQGRPFTFPKPRFIHLQPGQPRRDR